MAIKVRKRVESRTPACPTPGFWETALLERYIGHDVDGIAHDDKDRFGRVGYDLPDDTGDDLVVGLEQVVPAHPGLAGDAGGDDDDIGVFGLLVTVGADDAAVKAFHGTGLGQIQCLPLRDPLDDIDEDDIAQLLGRRPVGRRRSDVAGSDDRDLGSFSWHLACPSVRWSREKSALKNS